jgi:hypothetical protein
MWDSPEEQPTDLAAGPPAVDPGSATDVLCPQCRGKGRTPGQGDLSGGTCGVCRGRGMVPGAGAGAGAAAAAANSYQYGGDHYKQPDGGEEHWDRVWRLWGPGYFVGNITKYAERCMLKDGTEGLRKCGHYVAKLIELLESGIPPGYMGKAGGKPVTEAEVLAMTADLMSHLRADEEAMRPGPGVPAAGACTCDADRTGPSAEAHDPGCPAAAEPGRPEMPAPREVPESSLQILWDEIDVVCKVLDSCACDNRRGGEGCDGCRARRVHLKALQDEVTRQLAVRELTRAVRES